MYRGKVATASAPHRPWLGAHLRYGDSCGARGKRTGRVCAAAEDYARVAADMILQYGYRSVVVATDTDAALDAFSDELKRLARLRVAELRERGLVRDRVPVLGAQDLRRHLDNCLELRDGLPPIGRLAAAVTDGWAAL